ncbi:MAG: WD40 repeat domain-containing protein, partial [Deltaproteobacteria bacterium]|nr:WD40 repeat domain-containing protein [Deltaproteobacteria bacterium]
MKRLLLQFSILLISSSLYAYPTTIKKTVDLGIAQAADGLIISDDDRYLIVAAGETIKVIDLAKYALASNQPPVLSEDDDTDGNIGGMVFVPDDNIIYASQSDGDVLKMDFDTITETPESTTIAAGKTLTLMAADTSGASPTLYVLNNSDKIIYIYNPDSSSAATGVSLASAVTDVSFSVLDILFVSAANELYVAADAGRILFISSNGTVGSPIDIDITNGDDLEALTASEDGSKVYAVNSTDGTIEVISTSAHSVGTPIALDLNSELKDVTLMDIFSPDGAVYGFVSGQDGISIFDTGDNSVVDLDETNDAGTDDPISTTYTGFLITSADGYTYMSSGGGEISVLTEKPFITLAAPTYADSSAASATTLQSGGTFALSFQSDVAGTYEIRSGGDIDESGTLLTDTSGATSGSVVAATDTALTFSYDTNSSLLSEGANTVFVFVTDADSLTGRAAATVTVDTPPGAVTINSTGFGNGRVYATFTRLTAADIDHYNIYIDTDAATVQTKT